MLYVYIPRCCWKVETNQSIQGPLLSCHLCKHKRIHETLCHYIHWSEVKERPSKHYTILLMALVDSQTWNSHSLSLWNSLSVNSFNFLYDSSNNQGHPAIFNAPLQGHYCSQYTPRKFMKVLRTRRHPPLWEKQRLPDRLVLEQKCCATATHRDRLNLENEISTQQLICLDLWGTFRNLDYDLWEMLGFKNSSHHFILIPNLPPWMIPKSLQKNNWSLRFSPTYTLTWIICGKKPSKKNNNIWGPALGPDKKSCVCINVK